MSASMKLDVQGKLFTQLQPALVARMVSGRNARGFLPATREDLATRLACIGREIWEVEQALSSKVTSVEFKHRRVTSELVDLIVFATTTVCDVEPSYLAAEDLEKLTVDWLLEAPRFEGLDKDSHGAELTAPIREEWAESVEYWRANDPSTATAKLMDVLGSALELAQICEVDLLPAIEKFLEAWPMRGALHGGKNPRG